MIELAPERIAAAAGGEVVVEGGAGGPRGRSIDSREVGDGELFFGLRGERADGGEHAAAALAAGAWGVVGRPRARPRAGATQVPTAGCSRRPIRCGAAAAGARVAARARLPGRRDHRLDRQDVGQGHLPGDPALPRPRQPRELQHRDRAAADDPLGAARDRDCWCSRWRCGACGQIAELCEIAEPDVAAITNVGPVHLELLGTLEAIAEAKAEILAGLREGGKAVVPADAEALEPHLDDALETITFGPGGDVFVSAESAAEAGIDGDDCDPGRRGRVRACRSPSATTSPTPSARSRSGVALDATGRRDGASGPRHILLAPARRADRPAGGIGAGQRLLQRQPDLDARGARPPRLDGRRRRRIAVLGGMGELGPDAPALPPRDRRRTRAGSASTRSSASASSRATTRPTSGRRPGRRGGARRAAARSGRRGPGQGLALGRAGGVHRRAGRALAARGDEPDAAVRAGHRDRLERDRPRRGADRRDGGDADHDLPRAEVHRVPAA